MLDVIHRLYIQGKLGSEFAKMAEAILDSEMRKMADSEDGYPSSAEEAYEEAGRNQNNAPFRQPMFSGALTPENKARLDEMADIIFNSSNQQASRHLSDMLSAEGPEAKQYLADKFIDMKKQFMRDAESPDGRKLIERLGKWVMDERMQVRDAPAMMQSMVMRSAAGQANTLAESGMLNRAWKSGMGGVLPKVLMGAGAVAGIAGISNLMSAGKRTVEDSKYTEIFNKMMKDHPELDVSKAGKNYEALRNIAPHLAADQEAAYGFLRQAEEWPYLHMGAVKELAQAEKNISDAGGESAFSRSLQELGKNLSGLIAFGQ